MNLYLVTRWGNDESEDGPDGDDTNFLVRASTVEGASEVVDKILSNMSHKRVADFCHRVTRIGESISLTEKPSIILGPVVNPGIMHDDEGISNAERWARDEKEEDWCSFPDYYGD